MNSRSGTTLIEILLYAIIAAGIITITLLTAYNLLVSSDSTLEARALTENQKFVLQKINWVLSDVSTINAPGQGNSSPSLSVSKVNYAYNPLVLALNEGVLELTSGATTTAITNDNIVASSLSFDHLDSAISTAIRVAVTLSDGTATTTIDTTIIAK